MIRRPFRRPSARPVRALLAAGAAAGLVMAGTVTASAVGGPTVSGGSGSYTEQASATPIGGDVVISGGGSFAGQYVDFAIGSAGSTETLALQTAGTPVTTSGVVSVVGGSVYLGNGSTADIIGSVDASRDGQSGRALRVNFTSAFTNNSFETGSATGWTVLNQRIDLGVTSIAGVTTQDTSTYPGPVPNRDNNNPSSLGSLTTTVQTAVVSDGTYALQLQSSGMTTAQGYDVVHGPAVYSSQFEAAAGDTIYFDWRAYAGADDYHVFGYLLDQSGNQLEVLDSTGAGTTNWTTKATVIPSSGTYRFVFVSGTFDASGGQAAGASLVIDNVRVYGTKVVDTVVQQIARLLTYANSSNTPATSRTVTVTAQSATGSGTATVAVAVTPVDDPPTFGAVTPVTVTNNEGPQSYSASTGTLTASDPEGDAATFALVGGVADTQTIGGVTYTQSVTGTYATVRLAANGAYRIEPNATAIDARLTDDSEAFAVTATTNALTDSSAITVLVDVPPSAPGAPTGLDAVAGPAQVTLAWDAPAWLGGSAISHYVVQTSTDGSTWTTALTTADATPSATVTGLTNGTLVHVRVRAVNVTGTGAASTEDTATPVDVPGAPTGLGATPHDGSVTLAWTAPANIGGTAITGYRVQSSPDGTTWTTVIADTGSTSTSASVTGLTNGTAFVFRVAAINAVGAGPVSGTVTVTPRTVPGAPTGVSVTTGDESVTVTWSAPSDDGGNAVSGYRVQVSTDGSTWTDVTDTASTSYTVSGLTNGSPVQVRVRAINAAGAGSATSELTVTPRTVPDAPAITGATAGNRSASVEFDAPAFDGGAAILTYQYSLDGGTTWLARRTGSTDSPLFIGGLENGTTYQVLIRAINEAGASVASASAEVTPDLAPVSTPGLLGPAVPELQPGHAVLVIDNERVPVDASTQNGVWTLEGDGFTAALHVTDSAGAVAPVDPTTGSLVVRRDATVHATGTGFEPGSTVDVWLFSTPYLLGQATVGADGTFEGSFALPTGVATGEHTVQLNGLGDDGSVRSLATGVLVTAVPTSASLAKTGDEPTGTLLAAFALLAAGAFLVRVSRRRLAVG